MSILSIVAVCMSAVSLILHLIGKTNATAEKAAEVVDAAGKVVGSLPAGSLGAASPGSAPKAQSSGPVVQGFGPARDHRG